MIHAHPQLDERCASDEAAGARCGVCVGREGWCGVAGDDVCGLGRLWPCVFLLFLGLQVKGGRKCHFPTPRRASRRGFSSNFDFLLLLLLLLLIFDPCFFRFPPKECFHSRERNRRPLPSMSIRQDAGERSSRAKEAGIDWGGGWACDCGGCWSSWRRLWFC